MKPTHSPDERSRFDGHVRHYHRSGTKPEKSWEEWIEGKPADASSSKNWVLIIGTLVAVLALASIITGLIIELR